MPPDPDLCVLSSSEKDALIRTLLARLDDLTKRVTTLETENAALRERLNLPPKNPQNSSTPPSQGHKANGEPSNRRKGKGHPGAARALHPNPTRYREVAATQCQHCQADVAGVEHRKPKAVSRKLDPAKQAAFIKTYEDQLNHLPTDEAVIFADAVHLTHAVRPVGCWAPKEVPVAVEQSSGRDRLNIHGAIDLETGRTIMKDVLTVDAMSTILLLTAIEAMYPAMRLVHVFLDNARYHHAKLVQAWLAQPGRRIKLHFVPAYCPHLNPIERLWGLMHRHTTHNKCYNSFKDFSIALLNFLRLDVPINWRTYCDEVTDNFRVIDPKKYRMIV